MNSLKERKMNWFWSRIESQNKSCNTWVGYLCNIKTATESCSLCEGPVCKIFGWRFIVDLNRCQSYGQCVFAAPTVFRLHGEQSLEYDYMPDDSLRVQVERAAPACQVQAISIGRTEKRDKRRDTQGGGL
jgi:ferredoxin